MTFYLNVEDDNDDVLPYVTYDVGHDVCTHAAFHKAL